MYSASVRSLLSWNICHGGGSRRRPSIILELLEHAPEVILLSEYRASAGGQIRAILDDHGWHHQRCTDPPPGCNGMLLASRLALLDTQAPPPPTSMRQRWIEAGVLADGGRRTITLLGVHLPDEPRSTRRAEAWRHLITRATVHATTPAVIVGDLNAGRAGLDESTHRFGLQPGLGALATLGYADAFRMIHGDRREYSWFHPAGGAFRLDHTLISQPIQGRVRSAEYLQRPRETGVSDHAAMFVRFRCHGAAAVPSAGRGAQNHRV